MFKSFTTEHKALLYKLLEKKEYKKNQVIIHEGDKDNSLFLIYSGSARITKKNDYDEEIDIAFMDSGTYFGELSLLDNRPRSATIVAFEDCVCLKLSQISYSQLCRKYQETETAMLRGFLIDLIDKLRSTNENYIKYL